MKQQPFFVEQIKEAKRYCWNRYSHQPWFCGCVYRRDEEDEHLIVGVEVLFDPACEDRVSFVTEHEGVPLYLVDWDPEKHGERYDPEKEER
jgi:hypothetical protein